MDQKDEVAGSRRALAFACILVFGYPLEIHKKMKMIPATNAQPVRNPMIDVREGRGISRLLFGSRTLRGGTTASFGSVQGAEISSFILTGVLKRAKKFSSFSFGTGLVKRLAAIPAAVPAVR